MGNNILLHDEECERIVLGTLLTSPKSFDVFNDYISDNSFYVSKHKDVYRALKLVHDRGDEISIITVMPELLKANSEVTPFELTQLSGNFSVNVDTVYPKRLFDLSVRRKLWAIGTSLTNAGYSEAEDITDVTEKANQSLSNIFSSNTDSVSDITNTIEDLYSLINQNLSNENYLTGTPTGFNAIDDKGGLQGSDLIIIAGETSQGKTSLSIAMTMAAIKSGAGIAFYSMEMTKLQLTARMVSMESNISSSNILYGKLSNEQITAIDKGASKLANKNLYFDDRSNSNIDTIISSIRSLKLKYGIKGAVIDYLQILTVNMKGSNKEQQLGEASRRLKNLAKELDIFIIALSQLSRNMADPVPSLNRLRDSGQIAEAADMVILVYRPEVYYKKYPEPFQGTDTKGTALIDVAKGRNVGLLKFIVGFDAKCTKFYPLNEVPILPFTQKEEEPF